MNWILEGEHAYNEFGFRKVSFEEDEHGAFVIDANGWKNYLSKSDTHLLQTKLPNDILAVWNYAVPEEKDHDDGYIEIIGLIKEQMYRFDLHCADFPSVRLDILKFDGERWRDPKPMNGEEQIALTTVLVGALDVLFQKPAYRLFAVVGTTKLRGSSSILNLLGPYKRYWV